MCLGPLSYGHGNGRMSASTPMPMSTKIFSSKSLSKIASSPSIRRYPMFSNTVQHNEEERKDTILATESYAGDGDGIDPIPSVIKMDCAMELINGCLAGYRSCHHVTTGQLYNNVVIFILLWHDFLMLNIVDGSEAKTCLKTLTQGFLH